MCPGCERVFYDRSPNLSRVWCGMNADGPDGRACGTIAKVTAHRGRRRTAGMTSAPTTDQQQRHD
ncbi:CGNR zinc finger domain-containing protein [Rhodococcus sp. NBC_00297]|uniref:CGNR zinc finger domain-containing protein n=1 Tax=Rhodococcus sp. NBC_00297 TaxID=2976005 RepID=UPI003FA7A71B